MNGFSAHGLDEDAFGEKKGNIVQAFDAFRESPSLPIGIFQLQIALNHLRMFNL